MVWSRWQKKACALLVLATTFGCDGARSVSPLSSLAEGQTVRAVGRTSVSTLGIDGKFASKVISEWAVDAIVKDGMAALSAPSPSRSGGQANVLPRGDL